MSVVGFDLGNQSCFVAIARGGGIETVANEYSDRSTPSIVSFGQKQRFIGSSAKQQVVTNFKNTLTGFRNLIGRKFADPFTQNELKHLNCRVNETPDGGIGIQVQYLDEQQTFSPEQVVAMLLTQLKKTAESNLHVKVSDCVLSVPVFFEDRQRRAMLDAASTAGLNCLRLMNDTTGTALAYGIYKQDLPAPEEKPRRVVFVDMGHTALRVSLCSFNKGKLKVLATAWDSQLGGRDFDSRIQAHFTEEFKKRFKVDADTQPRAKIRLNQESEKLKKLMSANTTEIPMNIECFMDDKDVTGRMKRATMEEMCSDLLARVEAPLQAVLRTSGLSPSDIYAVEVVGGSSRIPAVRETIKRVFNMDISTTLNQDEAVARGCALQCAMLSPTFKVREFKVEEASPYAVQLKWKQSMADEEAELEVFNVGSMYPQAKMLTFYRKEPFTLEARYPGPNHFQPLIGTFEIGKVVPTAEGEASKVKVKVRMNIHGVFRVSTASLVEKLPAPEPEPTAAATTDGSDEQAPMDVTPASAESSQPSASQSQEPMNTDETEAKPAEDEAAPDGATSQADQTGSEQASSQSGKQAQSSAGTESSGQPSAEQAGQATEGQKPSHEGGEAEPAKKKVKVHSVDLPISAVTGRLPSHVLNRFVELEGKMIAQDKLEKERADAKNAVEEYVYELRDRLATTLTDFITEDDSAALSSKLSSTEDWLYDEGEDENKQVYLDKLDELRKLGDPVAMRYREAEERPAAFEELGKTIVHFRKILNRYADKDEKYVHISEEEMRKVHEAVEKKQAWMNEQMSAQAKLSKHQNPVILVVQIRNSKEDLEKTCNPIVNKPKPKVEPPKPEPKAEAEAEAQPSQEQAAGQQAPPANDQEQQPAQPPPVDIDVD